MLPLQHQFVGDGHRETLRRPGERRDPYSLASLMIEGHAQETVRLARQNPIDWLDQKPGNYLVKPDGTSYDLDAYWWTCDCPDATYRQRECKHAKGLRAALAAKR